MEKRNKLNYEAPEAEVLELITEGVLCESLIVEDDGSWGTEN